MTLLSPAELLSLKREWLKVKEKQWHLQCRKSLEAWCIEALAVYGQEPERHHRLLIEKLEAVERGQIDRLMVLMPPNSAKSTYVSVLFALWFMSRNPNSQFVGASHVADLAVEFSGRIIRLAKEHDGTLGAKLRSELITRWALDNGAVYRAVGVGGSITGRRADCVVIDDPVKGRASAESQTDRDTAINWYRNDIYTRLNEGGRIILVMTRWHEEDLGGILLKEMADGGDQWHVLKLPAIAEDFNDPLGREPGELLWPTRFDEASIARTRRVLGERDFGALYQQDPRPAGTSFFDINDVLDDGLPVQYPVNCDYVFATMDTAVKTGSKNDGTAVAFWAVNKTKKHPLMVLDWDILQIEGSLLVAWLPNVSRRLEVLAQACGARMGSAGIYIEDKASGTILLQQALRANMMASPIESKLTSVGKDERAISISGYVKSDMVKMSDHAYNKLTIYKGTSGNHFLMQVFRFQLGVKDQADDALDTFCYGVAIALGNSEGY